MGALSRSLRSTPQKGNDYGSVSLSDKLLNYLSNNYNRDKGELRLRLPRGSVVPPAAAVRDMFPGPRLSRYGKLPEFKGEQAHEQTSPIPTVEKKYYHSNHTDYGVPVAGWQFSLVDPQSEELQVSFQLAFDTKNFKALDQVKETFPNDDHTHRGVVGDIPTHMHYTFLFSRQKMQEAIQTCS